MTDGERWMRERRNCGYWYNSRALRYIHNNNMLYLMEKIRKIIKGLIIIGLIILSSSFCSNHHDHSQACRDWRATCIVRLHTSILLLDMLAFDWIFGCKAFELLSNQLRNLLLSEMEVCDDVVLMHSIEIGLKVSSRPFQMSMIRYSLYVIRSNIIDLS